MKKTLMVSRSVNIPLSCAFSLPEVDSASFPNLVSLLFLLLDDFDMQGSFARLKVWEYAFDSITHIADALLMQLMDFRLNVFPSVGVISASLFAVESTKH